MPEWVFERLTRDGGASGEAVPNAVEAGGWTSAEELLVREAVQNSVDAGRGEASVKVSFRLEHHVEGEKARLLDRISLQPFIDRVPDIGQSLPPQNVLAKSTEPNTPLHLLYIEDFNTKGLGGGLLDRVNGHFFRLLFLIGEGSKADQHEGSGGSFGFGKGVYAHNSNIRMIFAFSIFEATEGTNGDWARLLGCAYLPGHFHAGAEWTGRAWFGLPSDAAGTQSPYPVVNEEAVELARELGFAPRTRQDLGTSILVVGCDSQQGVLSIKRFAHAAETWWWPRLIDGDLEIELIEQGVRAPGLDPAGRTDLQPFIRCRNAIRRGHAEEDVKIEKFNRRHGLTLGELALTAIRIDEPAYEALSRDSEASEDRQGKAPAHRSVAYIRRPGMVVTYRAWSTTGAMSAVGTFEAHEDIDTHLKLSEPMEHDRWDPHSRRLERLAHGNEIVKAVEEGIRKRLRDYLKELQPPPPPPKTGLNWLGRRLGEMLAPRSAGPPRGPVGDRGGVSIFTEVKPHITLMGNAEAQLAASYSIALKPEVGVDAAAVTFSPRLYVLEGDEGSKGDLLPLAVRLREHEAPNVEGDAVDLRVELNGTERRVVHVLSHAFARDWAVSLHLEVAPIQEENA